MKGVTSASTSLQIQPGVIESLACLTHPAPIRMGGLFVIPDNLFIHIHVQNYATVQHHHPGGRVERHRSTGLRVPCVAAEMSHTTALKSAVACDLRTGRPLHRAARPYTLQKCTCTPSTDRAPKANLPAVLINSAKQALRRAGVGLAACMLTGTLLTSSALALPSDSQNIQSDVLVVRIHLPE